MSDSRDYKTLELEKPHPKPKSKCAKAFLIFQMSVVSLLIVYLFVHERFLKKKRNRKGLALFRSPVYQKVFNLEGAVFSSDFESGNLKSAM